MAHEFKMIRRVEFADTDMAGIAHFSALMRYMEETEHAFYRSLGFSVHEHRGEEIRGFPRLEASCKFFGAMWFEDEIEIELLVKRKQVKTIAYVFNFRRVGDETNKVLARGEMTVVYASKHNVTLKINALALPNDIASKIEETPVERLAEGEPRP
jgi:YbgC/YbaW family acyl-CoA thioester hydrolase